MLVAPEGMPTMRTPAFVTAALALVPVPASAQVRDWRPMGFAAQGRSAYSLIYLDVASVRKTGPTTVEMTTASVYATSQTLKSGAKFDWSQSPYQVDCATMTGHYTALSAHAGPAPLLTAATQGKPEKFTAKDPIGRAARAACSGQYEYLWQATPTLLPHARERFVWRAQMQQAMTAPGWYWFGARGKAPSRTSAFLHRGSIVVEPSGTRLVTIVTVTEFKPPEPDGENLYIYRTRIDCTARTARTLYNEFYGGQTISDPNHAGTFTAARATPMDSTGQAAYVAPVCNGDWSKARALQETPDRFRALAFTL